MHREARTHTILIANTGPRSYADNVTAAQLTDVAARVDRVLSRVPRYPGAGSRGGRAYFHWNPANTFVSAIDVQLIAMQGDMSQHALDSSAVLGFMRNQLHFYRRRYPVSLVLPHAVVTPGESAYA
eukprot:4763929-Pleurochrysis_carterae.AAC.1